MGKFIEIFLKSLVILIMICFVIALLAPAIIFSPPDKGHISATRSQIYALVRVLETYREDMGGYPSTSEGLKALIEKPTNYVNTKWYGPYLGERVIPKDAWGHELNYKCPGTHNPKSYDLWSYGKDHQEGGERDNADIGNW